MSSDAFGNNLLTNARPWLVPRFTPPRRIADIHDTHVSESEIVKTFQFVWGGSDGSGPANAGRGRCRRLSRRHRSAHLGAIQRADGCSIRVFTAATSAFMRARIAAFEPTSASDDAMIR